MTKNYDKEFMTKNFNVFSPPWQAGLLPAGGGDKFNACPAGFLQQGVPP